MENEIEKERESEREKKVDGGQMGGVKTATNNERASEGGRKTLSE